LNVRKRELLALQTVQEEDRNKFRFPAAQWRALADALSHINVMV